MPINLAILFLLVLVIGVFAYYFSRISAVKENYELEQFKALFEFATEGIIIANKEGHIVLANPKALQQFGYTSHELANKEIEVLIPQSSKHKHVQDRETFTKKPSHRAMGGLRDLYALRKDGTVFPVEVSLSHYKIGNQLFVIAFIIDITIRKQNEKELQAKSATIREMNISLETKVQQRTMILRETLTELEKSKEELASALESEKEVNSLKTRFISMASHEFRTPLSSILSSATLISKYPKEEDFDKREKHVKRIKDSVKNLTDILEDFLSIGKLEDGRISLRYEATNIREFMETICSEKQEDLAKENQKIVFHFEGNEWAHCDKYILRNMMINLISNAIKFSPLDGTIEVSVTSNDLELMLCVKDYGIGISKEDQEHLFERFFRGHNASNIQGTGLGLHIVSRYLNLLNGTIEVKSEIEKGTTFCAHLPQRH